MTMSYEAKKIVNQMFEYIENSRKSVTWSAVPDAPLFVYVVM